VARSFAKVAPGWRRPVFPARGSARSPLTRVCTGLPCWPRDVADTNRLVEGRLELGLGAGHSAADYEAAGLPFGRPGLRVDHVEQTITETAPAC
jgi:hypothetical protein